jgi:hypothetical protein
MLSGGCLPRQDDSVYQGGFNTDTYTPLTPYLWLADTNTSIVYKIDKAGAIHGAFKAHSGAPRSVCTPQLSSLSGPRCSRPSCPQGE